MTIQAFSVKTGIPKSTLRYYESKSLLKPKRYGDSGYRMYSEEQVQIAKLIASLRAADIPIQEIQFYLQAEEEEQQKLKNDWISLIKKRKQQLDISLHYLETNKNEADIFLFEKPREKVIWFTAESAPGEFKEAMALRRTELKKHQISIKNIYLRFLSGNSKLVKVEIGFGLEKQAATLGQVGGNVKDIEASICIGLTYRARISDIISGYRRLYHYCYEHNWIPAGPIFEWYRGDQINELDLIMPITEVGG
ncbi:MerR family transcriptional regulator [Ralstonia pickettii]|nr:MerR family transcriptional regulator [Ralstonia pickettii]